MWRQPAEAMLVFDDGDEREQFAFEIDLARILAQGVHEATHEPVQVVEH